MSRHHHYNTLRAVDRHKTLVDQAWDEYMMTIEDHFEGVIERQTTLFGKAYVWVRLQAEPHNLRLVQL